MIYDGNDFNIDINNYGRTIYLLGSGEMGPILQPKKVSNIQQVYDTFGTKGTLIDAFKQISSITNEVEVVMTKVTGDYSYGYMNLNIRGEQPKEDAIMFRSTGANTIYDGIYIESNIDGLKFVFPESLGRSRVYLYSDYEILGLLIRAINSDTDKGLNHIKVTTTANQSAKLTGLIYPVNSDIINMSGGYSGLEYSKNLYYLRLQEMYNILESEYIDIIVPLDANIDDIHPRFYYGVDYYNAAYYSNTKDYLDLTDDSSNPYMFHKQLLDFCKLQISHGMLTHGIIGYSKIDDIDSISNGNYDYMEVINASPIGTRQGFTKGLVINNESDDSFFISVVAGELKYSDESICNGVVGYAAIMASNTLAVSLTNKSIKNVSIATIFNTNQLDNMATLGVVSFRNSVLKGPVISNAVTPVVDIDSEFHYSCNVRMVQLTLMLLKINLDKYLGEDINQLMKDNIIDQEIKNTLQKLIDIEVLKKFDYTINIDTINGIIRIDLDLTAIYMVESIKASAKANFVGSGEL